MRCPKCGHEQAEGLECAACGIIFAKFEKREAESEKAEVEPPPATTPRISPAALIDKLPRPKTTGAFKIGPSIRSVRDLCHGLSRMIRAGNPIADSLRFLAEHSPKRLKVVVEAILVDLGEGKHLSTALVEHPHVFPPSAIQLVRAAERTGHLSEAFLAIAEAIEARLTIRQHLIRSLIYPLFVLLVSIFLLPLPELITGSTEVYLNSVFRNLFIVVGILFFFFVLVPRLVRLTTFGIKLRGHAWNLPWPATLYQAHARSILCRVFGRNLRSGLPVYESLESAALTTLDPQVQRRCTYVANRIAEGESLTESIAGSNLLARNDQLVLTTGETTGDLPNTLDLLADRYALQVRQGARLLLVIASALLALMIFGYVFMSVLDAYQSVFTQTESILEGIGFPKLDLNDLPPHLRPLP